MVKIDKAEFEIIFLYYSALPKIIKTGFAAINLIYFFTAGPDEVFYIFLKIVNVLYFPPP